MRLYWTVPLLLLAAFACSRPAVVVTRYAGGVHEMHCNKGSLVECLSLVDTYCKGTSYEVMQGGDEALFYGTEGTTVEGHKSFAMIRCLSRGQKPRLTETVQEPPPPAAKSAAPTVSVAPPPPANVATARPQRCVPGATQACVGAAACSGGQACLPDGSGFGPCDCGQRAAPTGS